MAAELVSQRTLAKILGLGRNSGYLTKLKEQGVLKKCYIKEVGRKHSRIDVEIAIQEIEASKDPSKDHVRQRWEEYRNGNKNSQASVTESKRAGSPQAKPETDAADVLGRTAPQDAGTTDNLPPGNASPGAQVLGVPANLSLQSDDQGEALPPDRGKDTLALSNVVSYQDAKTRKEIMLARSAELEYEERAGKLVSKERVQKTAGDIAALVREKLANIPDRLAQMLAAETGPDRIHVLLTQEINQVLHALADRLDREFGVRPAA